MFECVEGVRGGSSNRLKLYSRLSETWEPLNELESLHWSPSSMYKSRCRALELQQKTVNKLKTE